MVLLHPSRGDVEESWTSTGPRKHMDEFYSGWSPTVRKLLSLVDEEEIPEWTLKIHKPLASWVEGNVALMGDACHPTLPYVAQVCSLLAVSYIQATSLTAASTSGRGASRRGRRRFSRRAQHDGQNRRKSDPALDPYMCTALTPFAQSTRPCSSTARSASSAPRRSCTLRTKPRRARRTAITTQAPC